MPYKLTWEDEGCVVTYAGECSDDDFKASQRDLHADPRFIDLRYLVCRLSGVRHFSVSSEAVRAKARLDEEISRRFPGRQVAILVDGPVAFGLARMYQLHAPRSQWDTQIFRDENEARGWLLRERKTAAT